MTVSIQAENTQPAVSSNGLLVETVHVNCAAWPVAFSCPDEFNQTPFGQLSPDERQPFEEIAAAYLYKWTGKLYGLCELTVRPCQERCVSGQTTFQGTTFQPLSGIRYSGSYGAGIGGTGWMPMLIAGTWFNVGCDRCAPTRSCGCSYTPSISLPGPIVSVEGVQIDGEVLDPSAYRIGGDRHLERVDGGEWPACQDMNAAPGEAGTFTVSYTRGRSVPMDGQIAAGILAREFWLSACGSSRCQLPQRVQMITRQDVTIAFDSFEGLEGGMTGIWMIDSFLKTARQMPASSAVFSPDLRAVDSGYRVVR